MGKQLPLLFNMLSLAASYAYTKSRNMKIALLLLMAANAVLWVLYSDESKNDFDIEN